MWSSRVSTLQSVVGIGCKPFTRIVPGTGVPRRRQSLPPVMTTGTTGSPVAMARRNAPFLKGSSVPSWLRLPSGATIVLSNPAERALGLAVLQLAEALDRVVVDYRPNHLTSYLFELASRYSEFFETCPVLKAESDSLRTSRLLLCDLTARTIARGLELLGIDVVEQM